MGYFSRGVGNCFPSSGVEGKTKPMEDLAQPWKCLSLLEKEGPGCCLTKEESVHQFSIAAKFTTKRAINVDSIARTFNPLWRVKNGFKIKKIGDHEMLFSFETMEDVDRILSSEPWSFDKHLIIMQRYDHEQPFQDIKFEKTTFWVQVHGLPMKYMTVAVAEKVRGIVGEVINQSEQRLYDGGHFIRVKVVVNVTIPLCRGCLVSLSDNK